MVYGLGVEGYYRFVYNMFCQFSLWSILAIIVIGLYKHNGHLTGAGMYDSVAQMSLGNLQGYTGVCTQSFLGFSNQKI